jgi:alginate O-acetyltransferase complex protein AlgI
MVFSSTVFLFLFLPIVFLGCLVLRRSLQNSWLLLMSVLFYAWGEPIYVLLMLVSIAGNYCLGLLVHYSKKKPKAARLYLWSAIVFNLGILAYFKYGNFFVDNANRLLESIGWTGIDLPPVLLPIGISFFTFQALSYVIDVYRGEGDVQKNPLNLGLYISLFPQLIAGPIVRFHDVAKQIQDRVTTLWDLEYGVKRFIIGLAKKVLVANVVAAAADQIFDGVPADQLTPGLAWLAVLCYTAQIYFDFSGYSDMAIGLGRMFGFHYLENFRWPYVSQSITEFWRRWHISLSSWFRDYLYIPLGGNRCAPWRNYANLVIVFLLCGLWHGASWTFMFWGLYHGCFLVAERLLGKHWPPMPRIVRHVYVMLAAMVGWVFFRADDFGYAVAVLKAMVGIASGDGSVYYTALYLNSEVAVTLAVAFVFSMPVTPYLVERYQEYIEKRKSHGEAPLWFAGVAQSATILVLVGVLFYSVVHLSSSTYNPFIYFRF